MLGLDAGVYFLPFLFNFLVKCSADGGEQKAADEQQARRGGVARWRGGEEGGQTAYQEFSSPSAGSQPHQLAACATSQSPRAPACPQRLPAPCDRTGGTHPSRRPPTPPPHPTPSHGRVGSLWTSCLTTNSWTLITATE